MRDLEAVPLHKLFVPQFSEDPKMFSDPHRYIPPIKLDPGRHSILRHGDLYVLIGRIMSFADLVSHPKYQELQVCTEIERFSLELYCEYLIGKSWLDQLLTLIPLQYALAQATNGQRTCILSSDYEQQIKSKRLIRDFMEYASDLPQYPFST